MAVGGLWWGYYSNTAARTPAVNDSLGWEVEVLLGGSPIAPVCTQAVTYQHLAGMKGGGVQKAWLQLREVCPAAVVTNLVYTPASTMTVSGEVVAVHLVWQDYRRSSGAIRR